MTKFWRNNGSNNFSGIYDKYIDKIYRFVFLKVNSETIAQDITSETFTRVLEYMNKNSGSNIENIKAFLYRTAANAVIDYYRQKSRQNVPLNEFHIMDARSVTPEQKAQIVMIKDALQKIEGEEADVVMWHYVEDLSIKEIAEILDRPEGTIRVMLHRGLKELRRYLV